MHGSFPSRRAPRREPARRPGSRLWAPGVLVAASASLGACQAALDLERYDFPGRGGSGGGEATPPLLPGGSGNASAGRGNGGSETPPFDAPDGSPGDGPDAGCATACRLPHADAACVDAGCIIGRCQAPWRDANGLPQDGCEQGDVPPDALTLWFMADRGAVTQPDGSVSAWIDQSPNGYTATQAAPAQRPSAQTQPDGLPMLAFDGADDFFELPPGFADFAGASFFAVVEAEPNSLCAGILHFSNGPDGDDVEFGRHQPNLLYYEVQGTFLNGTEQAFVVGRRFVISAVQAASGQVELRYDGALDQAGPVGLPTPVERSVNYVGRNAYTEQPMLCSMYFHGRIGELLFYRRGLDSGERARVEAYLREKWQPE
jgi:hypothetical protein